MPNDLLGGAVIAPKPGDGPAPHDDDMRDLGTEDDVVKESATIGDDVETPEEEETEDTTEQKEDEEVESESEEEPEEEPVKIPYDRPTVKEMNEKFPGLFKEFPGLKEAFFREAQFTKLFPTVDDAQEAFNDNEAFNSLSDSALSGDPVPLIDSIEKADKKALEVFSAGFLPALYKKSPEVYSTVLAPILQNLVRQFYQSGKDDNIKNAAIHLADFLYGDDGESIVKGTKSLIKDIKKEADELKKAKDVDLATKFRGFYSNVEPEIERSMAFLISKQIDPKKELFSPFLRSTGVKEVAKRISDQLKSDAGHMTVMNAQWKRAKNAGYSDDYKAKIVSTYLARAKSLIPGIAAKVAADMLGTKEKAVAGKRERIAPANKQNNSGGVPRSHTNGKVDYRQMSDMDILNS